jgi:hypothetical protein
MTYFVSGMGRISCSLHPTRERPQASELRGETAHETLAQNGEGSQSFHQRFTMESLDSEQLRHDGSTQLVFDYIAYFCSQIPG